MGIIREIFGVLNHSCRDTSFLEEIVHLFWSVEESTALELI
jgi:hypothetical protein